MYKLLYFIYFFHFENNKVDKIFEKWFSKIFKIIVPLYFSITSRYKICRLKNSITTTDPNVIVSMTTFPARINEVWLAIESILRQEHKPDALILWLYKGEFKNKSNLPKKLLELEQRGLQIQFCEQNLKPHKKYYYTLKNYLDATIITIDDDVFYPPDFVKKLLSNNSLYQNHVLCFRARAIKLKQGKALPYKSWENVRVNTAPMKKLIPLGVGGVLYPPNSLNNQVFSVELIKKMTLKTDDLWLKVMALLNHTKVVCIGGVYPRFFISVRMKNKTKLVRDNVSGSGNDEAFKSLIEYYNITFYDSTW